MKQLIYSTLIILLLYSCGGSTNTAEEAPATIDESQVTLTAAQMKNAAIVMGKTEQRKMSAILKVNGKVDVPPQNMVSISVPLGGYLKTTRLLPGMHVNRGDIIAVVEDQQYIQLQQDYLTAKARIVYLQSEYERQKELNESKATSDKVYQLAGADYNSQKVLIASLAQKLKLAGINTASINETTISGSVNIHSPINGYVSKVNVNIGKYVSPTEVLFELINPTDIHLALQVFEKDLDKIFIGQSVVAYTNNEPQKKHAAEILLIGKNLSADRNTEVHCHFETYDKTLFPGTYMNAEIEVKNREVMALPADAVVQFENKQYAFIGTAGNTFKMIEVNTGITETGFIEITESEKLPSQNFVVRGAYSLLMSLKNKSTE
ncbi:MAG: efflux RND transporter periplasmic adaptor subunit [Chitinophagaceae bacterium]